MLPLHLGELRFIEHTAKVKATFKDAEDADEAEVTFGGARRG